jgi:hypothetical protein
LRIGVVEEGEGFEDWDRGFASYILRLLCAAATLPLFRRLRGGGDGIVPRPA